MTLQELYSSWKKVDSFKCVQLLSHNTQVFQFLRVVMMRLLKLRLKYAVLNARIPKKWECFLLLF